MTTSPLCAAQSKDAGRIRYLNPENNIALLYMISDNNANHSTITVINYFLKRILELHLAVLCHLGNLGLHTVLHDLFHGFSENIRLPDAVLCCFTVFYVSDQILRLLFAADNGCNLCLDMCLYKVDGRRLSMDFYAVFIAVADELRLVELMKP